MDYKVDTLNKVVEVITQFFIKNNIYNKYNK